MDLRNLLLPKTTYMDFSVTAAWPASLERGPSLIQDVKMNSQNVTNATPLVNYAYIKNNLNKIK